MGIPEWFLTVDSRKTKFLHNHACVQLLLHFKGPIAGKLEQDFNRLMSIGKLEAPSLYIPGYLNEKRKSKISYKLCGVTDPNEKSKIMFLCYSLFHIVTVVIGLENNIYYLLQIIFRL